MKMGIEFWKKPVSSRAQVGRALDRVPVIVWVSIPCIW